MTLHDDIAALGFQADLVRFVSLHGSSRPYVGRAVLHFVADALSRELGADSGGRVPSLVYEDGTPEFLGLLYDQRPSPRLHDVTKRSDVVAACATFAEAMRLPEGMEIEVTPGVFRFATEPREARFRATAVLVWVHAPGQRSWLVVVPVEAP